MFESQAIKYAASYAKIKTSDELVDKIFTSYIEKYKNEFELGNLIAYEKATRILNDFLEKNNAVKTFNSKQRIILIASSFDNQTLSAVAWLIANNVDIGCFELSPIKIMELCLLNKEEILKGIDIDLINQQTFTVYSESPKELKVSGTMNEKKFTVERDRIKCIV